MGRHSEYTHETADQICALIADGKSLRDICKRDDMPDKSTVMRWLANENNQYFRDQYAHAKDIQADSLFDDCLAIADQYEADEKTALDATDHIQRARLRIDTRKWMAGKLRPKKYGEKLDINANVQTQVVVQDNFKDEE